MLQFIGFVMIVYGLWLAAGVVAGLILGTLAE